MLVRKDVADERIAFQADVCSLAYSNEC
jgi:hypothetical protein